MLVSIAYFPNILYLAVCSVSNEIKIEACEHFIKQTYRNRTTIVTANGKLDLIIPIIKPNGNKTLIKDIQVSYAEQWNKQHIHAILSAYKSSPYFEFYFDKIIEILNKKHVYLWDLNFQILNHILEILQIDCKVVETSSYNIAKENQLDLRSAISPKNANLELHFEPYYQVFESKFGFVENLSSIDILSNLGPETIMYLKNIGNIYTKKYLSKN